MGLVYDISRSAAVLTAGNDVMTIAASATKSCRIIAFSISGLGTASAANEFGFFRQSALGTTGGGAVVPTPKNSANGAFGGVVSTTWVAQPTVSAALVRFGVNANGGVFSKTFTDAEKIDIPGGAAAASSLSLRCISGASTVSVSVTIEEF
jgi:hypothetical protein